MTRQQSSQSPLDPITRAGETIASASRQFLAAMIDADPQVLEIIDDDPAGSLRGFGIGSRLARQLVEEARIGQPRAHA
jgi:hypothetical protein